LNRVTTHRHSGSAFKPESRGLLNIEQLKKRNTKQPPWLRSLKIEYSMPVRPIAAGPAPELRLYLQVARPAKPVKEPLRAKAYLTFAFCLFTFAFPRRGFCRC